MQPHCSKMLMMWIAHLHIVALAPLSGCTLLFLPESEVEEVDNVPNAYSCHCNCERGLAEWEREFNVCLPDDLVPPTDGELIEDCGGRVKDVAVGIARHCVSDLLTSENCTCAADLTPRVVDECNDECATVVLAADCSNMDEASSVPGIPAVCLVDGAPVGSAFIQRSTCEVDGEITIARGDDGPVSAIDGVVEFIGTPCPDASCAIGMMYSLGEAVFEFFQSFPALNVIDNVRPTGSSVATALVDALGDIAFSPQTVKSTSQGRRTRTIGGSPIVQSAAFTGKNADPLDVTVQWGARACTLNGAILGEIEDEHTSIQVALSGELVNMPPTAIAGEDRDEECTSPAGAEVVLDATGSTDPDDNIALVQWRLGGPAGPDIGALDAVVQHLQALGTTETYVVSVVDAFWQISRDSVTISVVDTTAPEIACNAPANITPPDAVLSFTATAIDTCDPDLAAPVISEFSCFFLSPNGKRIDKSESCVVALEGDTIRIMDVGGIGTHIAWLVSVSDASGNPAEVECEVQVVKPKWN